MTTPTRRELLVSAPALVFAQPAYDPPLLSKVIFRCAMRRALRRLRQQRKIPYWQFRETRAALFNGFVYTHNGQQGTFLEHMKGYVERDAQTCGVVLAAAAGIFIESLILWIIENWNNILVFVVRNLKSLEVALDASEE